MAGRRAGGIHGSRPVAIAVVLGANLGSGLLVVFTTLRANAEGGAAGQPDRRPAACWRAFPGMINVWFAGMGWSPSAR
ncbi:MAG: hypothetical protein IPI73_07210 [Betaproteobacteria bacterium]|nr:hypothetical protein [Betaproteobacteria bacterium]